MTDNGDSLSVSLTGPRRDAAPYFILSESGSVGLSWKPGLTARSATPLLFLNSCGPALPSIKTSRAVRDIKRLCHSFLKQS